MSNIQSVYDKLKATRKGMYSWGARCNDGTLVLIVWQDEYDAKNRKCLVLQGSPRNGSTPNYKERVEHVQELQDGKECFLAMCVAVDTTESPRRRKSVHDKSVFIGRGVFKDANGDTWINVVDRKSI